MPPTLVLANDAYKEQQAHDTAISSISESLHIICLKSLESETMTYECSSLRQGEGGTTAIH
jgi:hypothetical protein